LLANREGSSEPSPNQGGVLKGVVIVSGGMDSVTLIHYLRGLYPPYKWHYLSFDYGQRHVKELESAVYWAEKFEATYDVINLQMLTKLLATSGSVLVDTKTEVPEGHYAEESMKTTVVPNRNSIMLSIATGVAVAEQADIVAAGMHAGDHFIYPDCRPEFMSSFDKTMQMANSGFWENGRVLAPFVEITKADIVTIGAKIGVDYSKTWSCYKGGVLHCGKCGTCTERKEAFEIAGVEDPTQYE
jgi:7-cyano-7-deazaguanine synthase